MWFAKDWDWDPVRGVLISSTAALVVIIITNVWGLIQGLLNISAWGSTVLLVLLLIGSLYHLFSGGAKSLLLSGVGTKC